jgi:hypothetical protein
VPLPKEYVRKIREAAMDHVFEEVAAQTDEDIERELREDGVTEEEVDATMDRAFRRSFREVAQEIADRFRYLTRAQRDEWIARSFLGKGHYAELRRVWLKAQDEQRRAGKLSPKLQGELAAENLDDADKAVLEAAATAVDLAEAIHVRWYEAARAGRNERE